MRVEDFLRSSAKRLPGKTALVAGKRRLTFAELDVMSDRLAVALGQRGIARGDRVVVFMENSFEAVVAIIAVLKAGAVFSPVNPSTKSEKLAFILNNSRAAGIITQSTLRRHRRRRRWRGAHRSKLVVLAGGGTAPGSRRLPLLRARRSPHTGSPPRRAGHRHRPRGAHLHLRIDGTAQGGDADPLEHRLGGHLDHDLPRGGAPADIVLCVLPLSFDYGLYQALMTFKVGATLVLERSFAFPHDMLSRAREERITGFPLVPTMAAVIVQLNLSRNGAGVRFLTNTAAALPRAHMTTAGNVPRVKLFSMYGLTNPSASPTCRRSSSKAGTACRPRDTEDRGVDRRRGRRRVPPGVVGQLVVRGVPRHEGYWDQEATGAGPAGSLPGKRCSTPAISSGWTRKVTSTLSAARTTSSSRAARKCPKEVEDVLYALDGVGKPPSSACPTRSSASSRRSSLREGDT